MNTIHCPNCKNTNELDNSKPLPPGLLHCAYCNYVLACVASPAKEFRPRQARKDNSSFYIKRRHKNANDWSYVCDPSQPGRITWHGRTLRQSTRMLLSATEAEKYLELEKKGKNYERYVYETEKGEAKKSE